MADHHFKKGNPGKPKGAQNKLTKTVKEVVLATFNTLQKSKEHNLIAFAEKNPKEFYQIAAKLIPTEINAKVGKMTLEIVRKSSNRA